MSSSEDVAPAQSPPSTPGASTLLSRTSQEEKENAPNISASSLPNTATSTLVATPTTSILSERTARSLSPDKNISRSSQRIERSSVTSSLLNQLDGSDNTRSLVIRAFSPVVALYASPDTDDLARRKGFRNGFRELLRPFGEDVAGKVVVRDSVGASRAWDDFGIRFSDLDRLGNEALRSKEIQQGIDFGALEEVLDERILASPDKDEVAFVAEDSGNQSSPVVSTDYQLFLRRVLSGSALSPHESLSHPVACVIAISSNNSSPIESLRHLYGQTSQGSKVLPPWVNPEYLRYYILVHDEDQDDLQKSNALFDQMKRHFGLHCHLLRLRSAACTSKEPGTVPGGQSEWLAPTEDLKALRDQIYMKDVALEAPLIFESDVTTIRNFVRELVTQSVVPFMENRVAFWNEQIASKRKGLSGRFISMSKRWTAFGSTRNSSSPTSNVSGGSSGNYDSLQGYYRAETPEATLRKMADFSLMLRDYKLAATTYDMLRTDFSNDKAWRYLAGANEMCAISNLLNPLASSTKLKPEILDQMLETATYSYLTRCSDPQSTLRCLATSVELLRMRNRNTAEMSAKWATRILELALVGPVGHVLVSERIATCFTAYLGSGKAAGGSRKRKAAFWFVMAAEEWLKLGKAVPARYCLEQAEWLYNGAAPSPDVKHKEIGDVGQSDGLRLPYREMQAFWEQLQFTVQMKTTSAYGAPESERGNGSHPLSQTREEISEKLDVEYGGRQHRRSLIAPIMNNFDGPLASPTRTRHTIEEDIGPSRDDDFE